MCRLSYRTGLVRSQLWPLKHFGSEKQRKTKMCESSGQTGNSDGNPAIHYTKSGINDTASTFSPILRLTGDPGKHECLQEEIWKWVQNETHSAPPFPQLSPRISVSGDPQVLHLLYLTPSNLNAAFK